uniref:Uncharacterized protein n=1 Tax=Aureoumbra lagunensis TaxID=44058 RepID=A0A7S3K2H2_9STRA|mmetsp:Transcript_21421/g.26658  ORF Transcript_21421/g.26658 Transcript_21421/m.26658 type:complete len:1227 (-) Transcript_21421:43-3723(-)
MLPLPQQRSPVITSSAGLTFLGGLVHRPTSLPSPLPTQEIMIGTTSPATQNKSTDNAQRPRGGELLDAALRRFDATPRLIPEFCQNINDNNNQQSPGTHWQPSVLIGSLSSRETHEPLTTQWYDIDNAVAENATSSPSDVPGGKGTGFLATAAAAGITGRLPVGGSHHAFKHIAPPVVEESKFESLDDETGGSKNRSEGDIPNEDSSQLVSSVDSDFLSDDEADLPYRPPLKRPNWGTIAMASSPDMLARESRYGSVPSSDIKQDSQLPSTVLLSKEFEAHDKNAFVDHRPQLQLFEPRSEFIDTMIRRSSMTRASPPGSNIQPPPVIYGSSLGALPSPALGQLSNRAAVSSTTRLSSMGTNSNQTIRRISDLDRGSHKKFLGSGSGDTSKQASKRTYSLLHGQVAASTTSNKVPDLCGISASGGIEDSSGPLAFDTPKHRQFVNPFKREDEEEILRERSHNRRRWSHVFPQGEEEFRTNWSGHGVGPNWKSLTTPAVLPLETDYLSPEFGTRAFKESNHSVLVSEENKHIIFEMVAQRIGGDYQIVKIENKIQNDLSAGFKSSTTRIEDGSIPQGNTVATSDAAIANISSRFRALQNRQIPLLGGRKREISNGLTHLKLSGRPPQSRLGGPDTSHGAAPSSPPGYALYTLSMGHRIQTFTYDAAQAKINVRSFRSRYDNDDPDNRFEYQYRLWLSAHDGYDHGEGRLDVEREASTISAFEPIPRTRRKQGTYIRRMQTFLKFPSPETNWNMLDQVISGYMRPSDTLSSVKFRRILFVVIPPKITSEAEAADYNTRIHRFQQLLDSKRASSESAGTLDIETPRQDTESSFVSTNSTQSGEKRSRKKNDVFKKRHLQITLENSRWRDEWLALESDAFVDSKRCWRFSIHWLLCSGWVVEEFLTSLSRKAKQYKLQLCQVPEYSLQLDIHPFLAPATAVVASKPRLVALLKRALVKHMGFVFDSITAIKHVSQRPGISPPDIPIQQFIHRLGTAFVRVHSDGRFVWIRNRLKSPHASFRIRPLNPDAILVPLRCRAQTLDLILGYCLGPLFCKYLVSIIRYQQKRTGTSISAAERCRLEHAFIDAVDLIADYIEPPVDRDATSMQAIDDDSWASASTTAASRPIPQVSSRRSVSLKIPADHSTTLSRSSSQFVEDDYDDATTGSTVTFSGHNLSSPPQVSSRLSINAGGTNSVNSSQPAAPQSSVQQQSATASSAGLSSNSAMSLSSV